MTAWRGVDTHVHLAAYRDPDTELAASIEAGVRIVSGTILASEYRRLRHHFGTDTEALQLGLGVHPLHAALESVKEQLELLAVEFDGARWISEIGLDGVFAHEGIATLADQRHVLDTILSLGVSDRLLSVHSRDAEVETIDRLLDAAPGAVVLHWFDGSPAIAARGVDAGWYFSVNSFMIASPSHVELLQWLPTDRIVTETDGPTTMMSDGHLCRPLHVLEIADRLAEIRGAQPAALRAALVENADRLEASVPTEAPGVSGDSDPWE